MSLFPLKFLQWFPSYSEEKPEPLQWPRGPWCSLTQISAHSRPAHWPPGCSLNTETVPISASLVVVRSFPRYPRGHPSSPGLSLLGEAFPDHSPHKSKILPQHLLSLAPCLVFLHCTCSCTCVFSNSTRMGIPWEQGLLFCSPLSLQCLERWLRYSRCLINICQMRKCMNIWSTPPTAPPDLRVIIVSRPSTSIFLII